MAINPKIKQKAADIRTKVFGSEVRESLASGLEGMSEDVESIKGRQGNVESQFQNVIDETTGKDVISAPELIAARNGKSNLKTRLDEEHAQVTAQLQQTEQSLNAQLAQTAANLKTFGAIGDGVADDTSIIVDLINNYDNIFVPQGTFICAPVVFENLSNKNIFGSGRIKLKAGSSRSGIILFKNATNVRIEGVIFDGNVSKVSKTNVGGWSDLVTFEDSKQCRVEQCTFVDGGALGLSFMNDCQENISENNYFANCNFAGVQVHGGKRAITGEYTDNRMPLNNQIVGNTITACGEGIRASGTVGTSIKNNKIINLNSNTGHAIEIYTATHPGYSLAMGTKNIVVENNYIETELTGLKRIIEVKNNQNDDGSGKKMENISIKNNTIILKDNSTPIFLAGYTTSHLTVENVIVEQNLIDSSNLILDAGVQPPTCIVAYRNVKSVKINNNRVLGKYRRFVDIIPNTAGIEIENVNIEQNDVDETTDIVVYAQTIADTLVRNLNVINNIFRKAATETTSPIILNRVYHANIDNNRFYSTRSITPIINTGTIGESHHISKNDFRGISTTGAITVGINDAVVRKNLGYVTENYGTASLTTNATLVSHGLNRTPRKVKITPKTPLGLAKHFWVSDVAGSVFKINLDTGPGSEVIFDWEVSYS